MKIIRNSNQLVKYIKVYGSNIGFIPTMGGLHKGHLSLITKAKHKKVKTVVSIFVNPKQFNNKKDFISYPRNIKNDIKILKKIKPNVVFIPKKSEIYKKKTKIKIKIDKFSKLLCGKFRPNHFEGVVDVIDRFLKLIKPKYIFLGIKDFQQLWLIKNYIKYKHKTKVIPCKTIRYKDGMALSTRNYLLSKEDKEIGSNIYKIIKRNKSLINNKNYNQIIIKLKKKIIEIGANKIDYLEIIDLKTNKKINNKTKTYKIFIAYYIKKVRLIDNI